MELSQHDGPYPVAEYPDAEIVFGVCYALGTDAEPVIDALADYIKKFHYTPSVIRISNYLRNLKLDLPPRENTEAGKMHSLIDAGNKACYEAKHNDFLALAAVANISETRKVGSDGFREPQLRKAHIIRSLKRPQEVARLRHIYRGGFYLISIFASESDRCRFLMETKKIPEVEAQELIKRDLQEVKDNWGQRTRQTFHLADVFVQIRDNLYKSELQRFLDLVFGERFISPTRDEHGMFLAAAAGVRSSQSGRQVGAAILNSDADIIAVGCNEVPKPGGGSYFEDDVDDARDHKLKKDSNDEAKREIEISVLEKLEPLLSQPVGELEGILEETKLFDITEYGRAVHAEMDAILACARVGVSPKGSTLYTTAFPCHNCARHILAVGIDRVVYVEPYPKSRAGELHKDAIALGETCSNPELEAKDSKKIPFVPFVGVGPRRYLDLFSMDLSSGSERTRKQHGRMLADFDREKIGGPRVSLLPTSYLEREQLAIKEIHETMERLEGNLLWQ